jgi:iron complex outermembrane receptor protein
MRVAVILSGMPENGEMHRLAKSGGISRVSRMKPGIVATVWLQASSAAMAQTALEEVTVENRRLRHAAQPAFLLDGETIREITPIALTDIFRRVQSVGIRTNSRGEAVLRLRGSEERQTGIFLDGAPLSVPWDGRVDLSALPAGIVERVRVTASAAPIEFGTNTALGAVEIQTPFSVDPGLVNAQVEMGTEQSRAVSATAGGESSRLNWLLAGSYRTLEGEDVASRSVIPYGPVRDGYRTNTDMRTGSLFAAAASEPAWGAMRVSLLSVDASRGIASQGNYSPESGGARYWRYPDWRFNQLTVNSRAELGRSFTLMSTAWLQHFEQTIEQYTDDRYTTLESVEDDTDRTLGARIVGERSFADMDVRLFGNAQLTEHRQVDSDVLAGTRGPLQEFQQNIYSLGVEVDTMPRSNLQVSGAIAYDLASTPKTGGRLAQEDLDEWAGNVAARWFSGESWQVAATLGQRTRFPALRELYGEALGEFLPNPGLQPETVTLADLTFVRSWREGNSQLRVTPWMLQIDDTLSRRTVTVDGVSYRQRYNLDGSAGHGLEASLEWRFNDRFELRLNATWQDLVARKEDDGSRPVLYQRPAFQGALMLDYTFGRDWDFYIEAEYLGVARDEDENGRVVELPTSWLVDMRLFRTIDAKAGGRWRAYAGLDNALNDVVLPQLGLPQPGRTFKVGFVFEPM